MELFIERIEKDQALVGENARKERGKGAAVGGHGRIGFMEHIAEGLAEERLNKDDEIVDFLAEGNTTNRNRLVGGFGESEFQQIAFVEPGDVADFIDIMIFGSHPENGDGGNALLRKLVGRLDGAESFVKGKCGTTEERYLLAADNRDGSGSEAIEIFLGFGACTIENILRAEDVGDLRTAVGGKTEFFRIAGDGGQIGGVFEEGLEFGEILDVVAEKLRRVG